LAIDRLFLPATKYAAKILKKYSIIPVSLENTRNSPNIVEIILLFLRIDDKKAIKKTNTGKSAFKFNRLAPKIGKKANIAVIKIFS